MRLAVLYVVCGDDQIRNEQIYETEPRHGQSACRRRHNIPLFRWKYLQHLLCTGKSTQPARILNLTQFNAFGFFYGIEVRHELADSFDRTDPVRYGQNLFRIEAMT